MLNIIRANAQSWGVKVAFAVIIIVFVFWGVGSFTGGPSTVAVTVNGEPITIQEFLGRYDQFERSVREQQPDLDAAALKQLHLRHQLMDTMILETLLRQEANRVGITVTPVELRQVIEQYPAFHNQQGKFDSSRYVEVLKAQRDTPGNFEERARVGLLLTKLQDQLTAGAYIGEADLRHLYLYQRERRTLEYVLYPLKKYTHGVKITPEAMQEYYTANQAKFSVPPQADVSWLLIGAASLADPASVSDADINAYYASHAGQYAYPEQMHARHIVILAGEQSSEDEHNKAKATLQEIEKRIRAGEDFADLARSLSQDGSAAMGGDLGWFSADQMVPAFSAAAAALQPGQVSGLVQTPFGYHLIKLEAKKPAGTTPLAEVSESIRARLAEEAAAGKVQDALEQVQLAVIGGKSLTEAGAPLHLQPKETGMVNTADLPRLLNLKPENITTILAAKPGTTLETPFMSKDGYVVVTLKESRPQLLRPLDEVKAEITAALTADKARDLALAEAKADRGAFTDTAPASLTGRVQTSESFGREEYIPGLGLNTGLVQAAFAAGLHTWLPDAYTVEEGVILARVAQVITPSEENWQAVAPQLTEAVLSARREQLFRQFLELLKTSATIELRNDTVLND